MDNVEKNILDILEDNYLIPTGWEAFESVALNYSDKTLIAKQYGGQPSTTGIDFTRVQLRAYSKNPLGARDTLQAIYNFFTLFLRGCTPYSKSYTGYVMQVLTMQTPFEIPPDKTDKHFSYALNLDVMALESDLDLLISPSGS